MAYDNLGHNLVSVIKQTNKMTVEGVIYCKLGQNPVRLSGLEILHSSVFSHSKLIRGGGVPGEVDRGLNVGGCVGCVCFWV